MDPKSGEADMECDACPIDDTIDIPERRGQTDSKPVRIDISQLHISDPNTVCTGFSVKSIDIQGPVIEPSASYPGPYTCGPTDQGPSPQPPLQQPLLPPPPQPPLSQPSQSGQQGGEDVTPMETAGPSEQGSSPPPSTPPQSGQQGGDGGSDGQGPNDQKPSPPPPQPPPQPTESEQQSKEVPYEKHTMNVYTQHIGNVKLKVDRMIVKGPMVLNSQPFTRPPPPLQKHGPGFRRRPAEPEDVSYKFTEEQLARNVEEQYIAMIAKSCDDLTNWRRLARKMDLDQSTLSQLEMHYGSNVPELIFQMLNTWRKRRERTNVQDLVNLLCQARMQQPALALSFNFRAMHGKEKIEKPTHGGEFDCVAIPK